MNRTVLFFSVLMAITATVSLAGGNYDGKKILYVDSYHEGYEWSDGVTAGIKKVVGTTGATLEIFRMDTKRNGDEKFKVNSGIKANEKVETLKPDIVIVSDDNAAKYFVVPFLKDKALPVVFCGINWDATGYGFPCSNVTGMLEVSPANSLLEYLKKYTKGTTIGAIGPDNETYIKEIENINTKFKLSIKSLPVKTMADWKKGYLEMQKTVNILIVENNAGIKDWNDAEASAFVIENTIIPTGTLLDFMSPFAMIGFARSSQEQGEWAGITALKILDGAKASQIPIEKNKKGDLYLNLKIAQKLGVVFDLETVKMAKQIIK